MRALDCDGVLCDGTHKYFEASRRTCKHARPDENAPGEVNRFSIAMDVIDRVPKLQVIGAHAKEKFWNEQIDCCHYAYEHGIDKPEIVHWKWPY